MVTPNPPLIRSQLGGSPHVKQGEANHPPPAILFQQQPRGDRTTTGLGVPETCAVLRRRYPDRQWAVCGFQAADIPKADLVVASDVIEHPAPPDELLRFVARLDRHCHTGERNRVARLDRRMFGLAYSSAYIQHARPADPIPAGRRGPSRDVNERRRIS